MSTDVITIAGLAAGVGLILGLIIGLICLRKVNRDYRKSLSDAYGHEYSSYSAGYERGAQFVLHELNLESLDDLDKLNEYNRLKKEHEQRLRELDEKHDMYARMVLDSKVRTVMDRKEDT